jgi:hypothetical protein
MDRRYMDQWFTHSICARSDGEVNSYCVDCRGAILSILDNILSLINSRPVVQSKQLSIQDALCILFYKQRAWSDKQVAIQFTAKFSIVCGDVYAVI